MLTQNKLRTQVLPAGSFVSLPAAFKEAPEGLRHLVKVEFRTVVAEDSPQLKLENMVSTDIILFDLAALQPSDIDYSKVVKDCELIREAALKYPEKLAQIVSAFQSTAPVSDVDNAYKIAEQLGLTEELSTQAGGGIIAVIAILAAIALSGCWDTCHGGSVPPAKSPTSQPPMVDAGTNG